MRESTHPDLLVEIEGLGRYTASSELGSAFVVLHTTESGELVLRAMTGSRDDPRDHVLEGLGLGDRLRFGCELGETPGADTLDGMPPRARAEAPRAPSEGKRLCLEIVEAPERAARWLGMRLSHPEGGHFDLRLGAIPRDHIRAPFTAGNEREIWRMQLPDLYAGDWLGFVVVQSEDCSPCDDVRPVDPNDDELALAILRRTGPLDARRTLVHDVRLPSLDAALAAKGALEAEGFSVEGPTRWQPGILAVIHSVVPSLDGLRATRERFLALVDEVEYGGFRERR